MPATEHRGPEGVSPAVGRVASPSIVRAMSACGSGYGSLSEAFARRVELALVHGELQELVDVAPSREVFLQEHRVATAAAGRSLRYRVTLERLARSAPGR